jgi:hypothetical protein
VYTPEDLDGDLDIAARTFINAGGVVLDREAKAVSLSRIFKWYAPDFGDSMAGRLRFLAGFLYDDGDRGFLEKNAGSLRVDYQDYDWRLNRN